jgi:hypothetical protein
MLTGCDPAELLAEVVRTYELNPVEARLAQIMVRYYGGLANRSASQRTTSGRPDPSQM